MKTETKTSKISELHFAKLQESNQKLQSVNQAVADLYQKEFAIKQDRLALDEYNLQTITERSKLIKELNETYGKVVINPETGEFTEQ